MLIGYARVSTRDQNLTLQRDVLNEACQEATRKQSQRSVCWAAISPVGCQPGRTG